MRPLAIESLSVRAFRNLARAELELGPRFNVLSGDNAQGKTNLLEAAYVLATSRSFRTSKVAELVAMGSDTASVRARVREAEELREQTIGLKPGMRAAGIDGKRPRTLAAYAVQTPVIVFHPGVLALTTGSGSERRRLLDRIALYRSSASLVHAEDYAKALRARQRVLELRGDAAADLEEWEDLIVRHGLALSVCREDAAALLGPAAEGAFAEIGPPGTSLRVRYVAGAPREAESFRAALARLRSRDRARGTASVGPHRDELELELDGRPVRGMASQGQHRAVVLALELAEIRVISEARGVRPILLLDDVSSELDRTRTGALFRSLRREEGQVLLTTTRPELIDTGDLSAVDERRDFTVVGGQIVPA